MDRLKYKEKINKMTMSPFTSKVQNNCDNATIMKNVLHFVKNYKEDIGEFNVGKSSPIS